MEHACIVQHGFEGGGGGYDVARGIEESVVGGAENFRGAAAENNIFGLHVEFLREPGDYVEIGLVGITVGDGAAIGEGGAGFGRGAVGVFVEVRGVGASVCALWHPIAADSGSVGWARRLRRLEIVRRCARSRGGSGLRRSSNAPMLKNSAG